MIFARSMSKGAGCTIMAACMSLTRINGQRNLVDALRARGVKVEFAETAGGHEWKVWRHLLADFAPRLFR